MKNRRITAAAGALAWALGLGSVVHAGTPLSDRPCLRGNEPAATLLFPYFEVDLSQLWDGRTTLVAITNVNAAPALTRAVVWSNWGAPVLAFDMYLAGHDVQTINLRDVLAGTLPKTGAAASPHGMTSDPPVDFPGCHPENVAAISVDVDFVRKALSGQEVQGGCWSTAVEEGVAVGYITVDVVTQCADKIPVDSGYFEVDGSGIAGFANTLMGDWFMVHPGQNFAQGIPAVHIAADREAFQPGDATFYRTFVGHDASDRRVPLSPSWGVRYAFGGGFSGGTRFLLWREPTSLPEPPSLPNPPGSCDGGIGSPWIEPYIVEPTWIWDEEGGFDGGAPISGSTTFQGFATEAWSPTEFPFNFGWLRVLNPGQSWLGMVLSAEGRYSVGVPGTPLLDPCTGE